MVTAADRFGVVEAAERRRSIRRFAPEPVPRSDVEALLHAASIARAFAAKSEDERELVVGSGCVRAATR